MADGTLSDLMMALGGGQTQPQGQVQQPRTFGGLSSDAWASVLGQIANVIGEGQTIGAGLGRTGAEMGQANIMARKGAEQRAMLEQFLGGLTGEGVQTQGVTVGPDGSLKVTGTVPSRTEEVETATPATGTTATTPATPVPAPVKDVSMGGGTQAASPFYQALQGIYGDLPRVK